MNDDGDRKDHHPTPSPPAATGPSSGDPRPGTAGPRASAWTGSAPNNQPTLLIGDILADRFRLTRFIARGGMGEVYEAEDLDLTERVAIKILRSDLASDPVALERMKREILLTRHISHRNVCRVFDVFHHRAMGSSGQTVVLNGFTMELLSGETLAAHLARDGALQPAEALPIITQMAFALTAAHRAGVIHRDFKSSNVMLVPDANDPTGTRVVVTDFGLARPVLKEEVPGITLTQPNLALGTADYMAPEQAQGLPVTPAADVYALGVVIFEMVTARRPHTGDTPIAVLLNRVNEEPPSPRSLVPDLDPTWESVILRCLARRPEDRFATALEVADALGGLSAPHSVDSGSVELGGMSRPTLPVSRIDAAKLSGSGRPLSLWLLGTGVVVATAAAGVLLFTRPSRTAGHGGAFAAPTQLTTSEGLEVDPDLAPNGGAIAFSSNRSGTFEIYVRQLTTGGREIQLTQGRGPNFQPDWSPDGQRIAYASFGRSGIWIIPSFGGEPLQLTDFGSHPAWSPDGTTIAFQWDAWAELAANSVSAVPPSTVWLVDASGGKPRQLTKVGEPAGGHGAPSWCPDGKTLFFSSSDRRWSQLWRMKSDGQGLAPVDVGVTVAIDPVVSPNGRSLYYSAVSEGERYGVWRVPIKANGELAGKAECVLNQGTANLRHFSAAANGTQSAFTALTTASNLWSQAIVWPSGQPAGEPAPLTRGTGRNSRPAFSPDGSMIAFDRWRVGVAPDIWVTPTEGGEPRQLTVDQQPETDASWLPDGSTVVFTAERGGQEDLYAADLSARKERLFARLAPGVDAVKLSPDGTMLAYHQAIKGGATNVWVARADGSEARQLTFDKELMGYPCWSRDSRWLSFEAKRGDDYHVMVIPVEGGAPVPLTGSGLGSKDWPYGWAPDNDRIVFAGFRDGSWDLWWVSRTTRREQRITTRKLKDGYVRYSVWSPGGDRIVFELAETTADLWMLDRTP